MRIQGDGGAAPDYDRYLGCDAGQEPSSTVVVVVSSELLDKSAQTCGTRLPISMLEAGLVD